MIKKYWLEISIGLFAIIAICIIHKIIFNVTPESTPDSKTSSSVSGAIKIVPDAIQALETRGRLDAELQKKIEAAQNEFEKSKQNFENGVVYQLPSTVTKTQHYEKALSILGTSRSAQLMAGLATMFELGNGETQEAQTAAIELLSQFKGEGTSRSDLFVRLKTLPSQGFSEAQISALIAKFGVDRPAKKSN